MRALAAALYLALASCAGPSKPPCTAESVASLRQLYLASARSALDTGACKGVEDVDDCPELKVLLMHFEHVSKEMCQ